MPHKCGKGAIFYWQFSTNYSETEYETNHSFPVYTTQMTIFADVAEVPTKCLESTLSLDVNASLQYIDFEGRSDGESVRKIISMMKPQRVILVRGSPEATQALAAFCRTSGAVQGRVFTPRPGEVRRQRFSDRVILNRNFE